MTNLEISVCPTSRGNPKGGNVRGWRDFDGAIQARLRPVWPASASEFGGRRRNLLGLFPGKNLNRAAEELITARSNLANQRRRVRVMAVFSGYGAVTKREKGRVSELGTFGCFQQCF